ncbi:TPA: hypothetical protein QEL68_002111 [Stenotrophomonas maltophilia]|uniref:hypothetical protein n=1 Tax=Stenotrophomonas maltophilia TaxID=40324 RepID=UPI0018D2EA59|nr:hypothetical protein [Stenotrophomonas maltophilia]HDS1650389.1 hypothetical protein [Stenotrophomonas maltophilia]
MNKAAPWIVVPLCLMIAFSRPLYGMTNPDRGNKWVQVYQVQPVESAIPAKSSDEAFGRQLDTLTAYYDKLINLLLFLLGTITTLAFFTVRASSHAETEKAAKEALGLPSLQALISAKVAEEVEAQVGSITELFEKLQGLYEGLDDIAQERAARAKTKDEVDTGGDRKTEA